MGLRILNSVLHLKQHNVRDTLNVSSLSITQDSVMKWTCQVSGGEKGKKLG